MYGLGPNIYWVTINTHPISGIELFLFCWFTAGGFFASGFKRAFKMKDFGQTIPGHGGVTDRFDCQMIMAMFAYVYYWNYVASPEHTVGEALDVSVLPSVYSHALQFAVVCSRVEQCTAVWNRGDSMMRNAG
jgi:hypothetical protein